MANLMTIQATEFKNLPQKDVTYGFRVYDDYGVTYVNTLSKDELENFVKNPLQLFEYIVNDLADVDIISDMVNNVLDLELGVEINGEYFESEQIKPIIEKHI